MSYHEQERPANCLTKVQGPRSKVHSITERSFSFPINRRRSPPPEPSTIMLRQGSRLLTRATTMTWRLPFSTDLPVANRVDSTFAEAWKKVIPNTEPPMTPSAFMKPRPETPSSIPSKLSVNFVLPYSSELSGKEVIYKQIFFSVNSSKFFYLL